MLVSFNFALFIDAFLSFYHSQGKIALSVCLSLSLFLSLSLYIYIYIYNNTPKYHTFFCICTRHDYFFYRKKVPPSFS